MKDIETLLNKYFEGETTCEEERRLRRFFAEGLVPEHLEVYRPMKQSRRNLRKSPVNVMPAKCLNLPYSRKRQKRSESI